MVVLLLCYLRVFYVYFLLGKEFRFWLLYVIFLLPQFYVSIFTSCNGKIYYFVKKRSQMIMSLFAAR